MKNRTQKRIVTTIFRDSYKGAETQVHTFSPAIHKEWIKAMVAYGWKVIKQEEIDVVVGEKE